MSYTSASYAQMRTWHTMITWETLQIGENKVHLTGEAGVIEAIIHIPEDFALTDVKAFAVCCHPHPLYAGTMTNKVVHTLAKVMTKLGLPSVRFNFRGVGKSEGEHDGGIAETRDLISICEYLKTQFPDAQVWLSGFSFGSFVAANAAATVQADQLVTISPAVEHTEYGQITMPDCPWLVVMGEEDEVVSPTAVYNWVARSQGRCELVRFPETGHFYHGKLVKLTDFLLAHFADEVDNL